MPRHLHLLPPEYRSAVRPRSAENRQAALVNELNGLRNEIKRLSGLIKFKNGVLLYAAAFFEDLLRENKPQSIGRVKRLISKLKGAVDREQGGLPE